MIMLQLITMLGKDPVVNTVTKTLQKESWPVSFWYEVLTPGIVGVEAVTK